MRCAEQQTALLGEQVRCYHALRNHPIAMDGRNTKVHNAWTDSGDHLEWKTTPSVVEKVRS